MRESGPAARHAVSLLCLRPAKQNAHVDQGSHARIDIGGRRAGERARARAGLLANLRVFNSLTLALVGWHAPQKPRGHCPQALKQLNERCVIGVVVCSSLVAACVSALTLREQHEAALRLLRCCSARFEALQCRHSRLKTTRCSSCYSTSRGTLRRLSVASVWASARTAAFAWWTPSPSSTAIPCWAPLHRQR